MTTDPIITEVGYTIQHKPADRTPWRDRDHFGNHSEAVRKLAYLRGLFKARHFRLVRTIKQTFLTHE